MLRVQNDIIRALGDNKVVLLVLIDIFAAFDTGNHERLLSTLHARLISGRSKYDHITPVLKDLYWLPVVQRIQFKVVTTVFKALHNIAPAYLQERIVPYAPSRGLRSREHNHLCVPFTRSTVAGSRAFSVAGPKLWNALPQYLRDISDISTFKKQLKTHLFLQHYGL